MKEINPYLIFDGRCREAMTFYAKGLGAELQLMPYADAPVPDKGKAGDLIIHARLQKGPVVLMASDGRPGEAVRQGDEHFVSVQCESRQEVDRLFAALGAGGKPIMPPAETFWNAYFGMLTDKFGVGWMFNYELGKK